MTSASAVPWERWLRNPLAMSDVKAIGGQLEFNLLNTPVELAYYSLDKKTTGELPYTELFSARLTREVADGVKVGLTWAMQSKNDDYSSASMLDDQKLLSAEVIVGF